MMHHCGKVPRKYRGQLTKDNSYFNKIYAHSSWHQLPISGGESFYPSSTERTPFS